MKTPKPPSQSPLGKWVGTLQSTLTRLGGSALADHGQEEVTAKTGPAFGGKAELREDDVDWLLSALEPLFFEQLLPKLKDKRVLYAYAKEPSYLPMLLQRGPERVFCVSGQPPQREFAAVAATAVPVHFIAGEFSQPFLKPNSFDAMMIPETSCKGIHFMTRASYWASLLRRDGLLLISLPHPQLRFFLSNRDARRRSSRTATFERVLARSKENHLEIIEVREPSLSQLPGALLKKHPLWQQLGSIYDELPGVLGLCLKKRSDG